MREEMRVQEVDEDVEGFDVIWIALRESDDEDGDDGVEEISARIISMCLDVMESTRLADAQHKS